MTCFRICSSPLCRIDFHPEIKKGNNKNKNESLDANLIVYTYYDGELNTLWKDSIPSDERATPSPTWDTIEIYDPKDGGPRVEPSPSSISPKNRITF